MNWKPVLLQKKLSDLKTSKNDNFSIEATSTHKLVSKKFAAQDHLKGTLDSYLEKSAR